MRKNHKLALLAVFITALLWSGSTAFAATSELFISEYIEGSSNNKAIEIYNGTGTAVELTAYDIQMFFNGSGSAGLTIALTGTVADGDVHVLANSSAAAAILAQADQTNGAGWFNGDDVVVLRKDGTIIDSFGTIGTDPGSEWAGGGTNDTLRRKADICAGDPNASDAFDAATEWDSFATDTFDGLGSHTANCGSSDPVVIINEIMQNPSAVSDSAGEWLELYNPTTSPIDIDGWTLQDNDSDSHVINNGGPLVIPAGGYLVLGNNINSGINGGLTVDYSYGGSWFLANGADEVVLLDASLTEIDRVEYDGGPLFPDPNGASMALSDPTLDNNVGASWCTASTPYGNGDLGTPGAANDCEVTPPPPTSDFVINEISADPDSTLGDANGDGVAQFGDDEFVEIVNNSGADADLSGWTLSDAVGVRHTFPANTIVGDGCAIVVFGGGTPTGVFGNAIVQTASSGTLGLNNGGDTVTLNDGSTDAASYVYGGEGGDNQSLTLDPDVTGTPPLIKHTTATGANGALYSPGTQVNGTGFSGCPVVLTYIHDVQGSGAASPLVGQVVTVEGIVVGDFQDGAAGTDGDLNGFHIQEEDSDADGDAATSEGIFVYDAFSPAINVAVGDLVQVTGQVAEFNDMTELTNVTVTIVSSGNTAPTPASVTLPVSAVSDLEAFEGMSVTFPQTLYINEYFNYDRFNEIVLGPERFFQPTAVYDPGSADAAALADLIVRSRITLDDGRTIQNPDPARHPNGFEFTLANRFRGGDTLDNVVGVLDYSFGLYRIQPTAGATYTAVNPREAAPDVGGSIEVASFNVLNYFTTLGSRGADNATEFNRQRDKIFAALADIDADVFGLIEIENNGTALANLVDGLNNVVGADTYAAITTGPIGSDEITVALIYKPATVTPVGAFAVLDDASFVDPLNSGDDRNRPALAQTFMDGNGGVFTVVVNHLKSKGSGCGMGDDDAVQGNCNLTRTLAAQALVNWLDTDPTNSGDADFLIIGDLNSYDKEDPIALLVDNGYTDLLAAYGGEYAYSYVFDGQLGYLDYALANANLTPQVTGTAAWHINADEPDLLDYDTTFKQDAQDALYEPNAYRASDHDPVLIGLDLNASPVCSAATPSTVTLWPPNGQFVSIDVLGVTDAEGDALTYTIDGIYQDEAVDADESGNTAPDGRIIDGDTVEVRAERVGDGGNGRVYHIFFSVVDSYGGSCSGEILVNVPVSRKSIAVDDGALFDSTVMP